MALARMMRCRRAVLAAAILPSRRPVACSSRRRATAVPVSADTGRLCRAIQARVSAASPGGSARCLVLKPNRSRTRRMAASMALRATMDSDLPRFRVAPIGLMGKERRHVHGEGRPTADVSNRTCWSSRPVGVAAVGYCHYRYASLAFVNGVKGAVVAAPSRAQLVQGRV